MTTFKDAIISVIGTYTPSGSGISGVDFEFIAAVVMFGICLWFTFSLLRTFFCGLLNKRW